jgi:predicted GIY-YIG superfamily endonuclease
MPSIYILRLEEGKFYVGKTENVAKRFQEHLAGTGSAWTRKYKPIALEREIPNASPFDEDKYTKEYMAKHGINRVRGGAYVEVHLPEYQYDALETELRNAANVCTRCGRAGHFVKDCFATTDISGLVFEDSSSDEEVYQPTAVYTKCAVVKKVIQQKQFTPVHTQSAIVKKVIQKKQEAPTQVVKKVIQKKQNDSCFRCGRVGHFANTCYASTHAKGYYIDSDDSDNSSDY